MPGAFVAGAFVMPPCVNVNYGVAQSSSIASLLFTVCINDIINSSKFIKFYLYADDTSSVSSSRFLSQMIQTLQFQTKEGK